MSLFPFFHPSDKLHKSSFMNFFEWPMCTFEVKQMFQVCRILKETSNKWEEASTCVKNKQGSLLARVNFEN